ncbi:hypothetical protein OEZ86_012188 [Tetradesmus obliquus]|nr:hypothetical protein OEZ86_012188 [Tetradesmus obliquus]
MGNALVCFEQGHWDSHHHVQARYKPAAAPKQNMTQPLSHYFISSGHNSYLEGNQLTSNAGTATIESGLRMGCRVIELDVYDGPNGAPICTHGGTLTSTVLFKDAVRAIAKHGFHASPYPVILTIENHAGTEQQAAMAADLHDVLGQRLFEPAPEQLQRDGSWLSPEALKHKVLIRMKVKEGATAPELARLVYIRNTKIAGYEVSSGPAVPSSHSLPDSKLPDVPEFDAFTARASAAGEGPSSSKGGSAAVKAALLSGFNDVKEVLSSGSALALAKARKGSKTGGAEAAAAEGVTAADVAAVGVGGTDAAAESAAAAAAADPKAVAAARQELQLDGEKDDTLEDGDTGPDAAAAQSGLTCAPSYINLPASLRSPALSKVYQYSSKHLLRCYPGGWRMIDNSNVNPMHAWSVGASLAALNWQLWDEAIWINQAFFSQVHHCGYLLKPSWMTSSFCSSGLPVRPPRTLRATVYSAHVHQGKLISIRKDDPYVELKVKGLPCDSSSAKTEHANDTGRLVVDKAFDLSVTFPEMAVLLVLLKDLNLPHADVILGYAALPLATLAPGEYKLMLFEPFVNMEHPKQHRDMWVKLKLEWLQGEETRQ